MHTSKLLQISLFTLMFGLFANRALAADGDLDTAFGSGGKVTTAVGTGDDKAYSVIQQSDGKLVAAGSSDSDNDGIPDVTLMRYNSDGSLDTTFNGTGTVTTTIGIHGSAAYSVIQQSDGKLVVAGTSSFNQSQTQFTLVRYNSNGSLDTSFNGTGVVTTMVGMTSWANSVIQQSDGKLVAAGSSYYGSGSADYDFALVRYNSNGTLDTTFGYAGKVATNFSVDYLGYHSNDYAYSVIQQSDGKLVASGSSAASDDHSVLARYNADGSLDTSFGGNGKVAVTPPEPVFMTTPTLLSSKVMASWWRRVTFLT